jgi:hypothetical protein
MAANVMEDAVEPEEKFVLELAFSSEEDMVRAKKGLRKAAGQGNNYDLACGVLAILETGAL